MALDRSAPLDLLGQLNSPMSSTGSGSRPRRSTKADQRGSGRIHRRQAVRADPSSDDPTQRHSSSHPHGHVRDFEFRIPKLRQRNFLPSALERYRRVDHVLFAIAMEAYVHGVSTRKVDDPA